MGIERLEFDFKQTYGKKLLVSFYDENNIMVLYIFESGWKGYYHVILEFGETSDFKHYLYNGEQIAKKFGIQKFIRRQKLINLNSL